MPLLEYYLTEPFYYNFLKITFYYTDHIISPEIKFHQKLYNQIIDRINKI